jgi:hypothetical protein
MIVAKKVAKKLLDENKGKNRIVFSIRETTKDSKKRTYCYIGVRDGDNAKVRVDKKNIKRGGGLPKSFYLKKDDDSYFLPNGYKLKPEFQIKDEDIANIPKSPVALYIVKGILTNPYLVYEDDVYIEKYDGTPIKQFRILYNDGTYFAKNTKSKETFIIENSNHRAMWVPYVTQKTTSVDSSENTSQNNHSGYSIVSKERSTIHSLPGLR